MRCLILGLCRCGGAARAPAPAAVWAAALRAGVRGGGGAGLAGPVGTQHRGRGPAQREDDITIEI